MPCRCSSSSGPMPDSMSTCGELSDPADRITSLAASNVLRSPLTTTSTPVATLPFNTMRCTAAPVSTVRFAPVTHGFDEGGVGRVASSSANGVLHEADAVVHCTVEVVRARDAQARRGLDEIMRAADLRSQGR